MRDTLDQYWMKIVFEVSRRSTCIRRAVGVIITNERGQILSTGYNGVPSQIPHCTDEPCAGANDSSGQSDRCLAVHAEVNALLQLGGKMPEAHTLYTTTLPCFGCAKAICNTSIQRVVHAEHYADPRAIDLFRIRGIKLERFQP